MPKRKAHKSRPLQGLRLAFFKLESMSRLPVPLFGCYVSAGFPSPADDHLQNKIDLNTKLIDNPAATYLVRVGGESMKNGFVRDCDWLIVDRSKNATHDSVVIAILDGEHVCKRLYKRNGKILLQPDNPAFKPVEITQDMDFEIFGVVTYSIHDLR